MGDDPTTHQRGDALTAAMERIAEVVLPAIVTISETMCKAYHEAGMPYGDTSEGMLRWMKELYMEQKDTPLPEQRSDV